MKTKLFEVKNGENQGVYLRVSNDISREQQLKILGSAGLQAGYIDSIKVDFYKKHGAVNQETLQSLDTFKQLATIWRLNPYGTNNDDTLKYKKDKIEEAQKQLDNILESLEL